VLHYADPWLSEKDIDAGERWASEIGKLLEAANFGIICLTAENLEAPWILFEAGALSKALQTASVCPYLLDLDFKDLTGPLAQFQAKKAERSQTLEMLYAINSKAPNPLDASRLTELFEALWPKLESGIKAVPPAKVGTKRPPDQGSIIEELVAVVRNVDHRLRRMEGSFETPAEVLSVSRDRPARGMVRVHLTVDDSIQATIEGKTEAVIEAPRVAIISAIAALLKLDRAALDRDWYLLDPNGDIVNAADVKKYFSGDEKSVTVTRVPF
jgi:hypothetical protein